MLSTIQEPPRRDSTVTTVIAPNAKNMAWWFQNREGLRRRQGLDTGDATGEKPSPAARIARWRFVKGDKRINRSGRPQSFEQFRKLVQRVLSENVTSAGEAMTAAEAMVRHAVRSKDPALHRLAFEYAFGKVPDKLETTGLENRTQLILHYAHERRDALTDVDAPAVNGEGARRPLLPDAD
jgi:hypothetical protein